MSYEISMAHAACVENAPVAAATAGRCALLIRADGILAGKKCLVAKRNMQILVLEEILLLISIH